MKLTEKQIQHIKSAYRYCEGSAVVLNDSLSVSFHVYDFLRNNIELRFETISVARGVTYLRSEYAHSEDRALGHILNFRD